MNRRFQANLKPGISGTDGSSLAIDDNHFFDDNTARDAYFTDHADEQTDGVFISVGAGYQQWDGDSWVDKTAVVTGPAGADGTNGTDGDDGADGDSAYVYIAYASDDAGTGFTLTFNASLDYIAILSSATEIAAPEASDFAGLWKNYKGATGAAGSNGTDGDDGADAFVYVAYASADDGTGFTMTFNAALDFIAFLPSDTEIASPQASDFAGLWKNYKGAAGADGVDGEDGLPGAGIAWKGPWDSGTTYDANDAVEYEGSSYIANAEATNKEPGVDTEWDLWVERGDTGAAGNDGDDGADGKTVLNGDGAPGAGIGVDGDFYIDTTNDDIYGPKTGGAWGTGTSLIGPAGETGSAGTAGEDGDDAYVYIAYASADDGTGFTLTFNSALDYIAIKSTTTAIGSPQASDFAGLWKNYKGVAGADGTDGEDGEVNLVTTWSAVLSDVDAPSEKLVNDSACLHHGVESIGAVSFDNSTHVLSVATGMTYWYKGKEIATSALTCDLDLTVDRDHASATLTDRTLYFIYFKDATGKLYWSPNFWDLKEVVPVVTVFWNGAAAAIHKEWHNHTRDIDWHINAHNTIGARYYSGLALTKPSSAFDADLDLTTGYIYDEDLLFTITNPTTARAWYFAAAGSYTFADIALPYTGTSGAPTFLDTDSYTLEALSSTKYACYWVYGTGDIDRPIYIIPTQAAAPYNTVTLARAEPNPALSGVGLTPEIKLLYRFIYKGDGEIQEVADYRLSSSLPAGAISPMTASSVTFVPTGNIAATNVQAAVEELDTEKIAIPGSSAQGDVLYHNGTVWTRLAAGTSGYYLKTNGAAANPEWAEVAGGSTDIGLIIALGG